MRLRKQRGLTLVELMISLTVGLVVIGAGSTVYVTTAVKSGSAIASSRLNQELMTLMSIMVLDIRRAGYWADAAVNPTQNPFSEPDVTALAVRPSIADPVAAATSGQCILFAYDADDDGILDNDNLFGFRLNNGVVQMRRNGDVVANARHDHCNDAEDNWQDVTDGNLFTVTDLTFDSSPSQCLNMREPDGVDSDGDGTVDNQEEEDCYQLPLPAAGSGDITVETREVVVNIAAQLTDDPDVRVQVAQSVRVRNDLLRER
ncbi:hypothetical protein Maes01_02766 [Microbulbifer aestuariivivens]|uniref:Prepilin-type N-terminal cleavage/methylation domain-containing protein n=1 Tax=Microbulbifer aestuariivivens TaxID=1908308 RepID=A0ABP9WSI5_9GAMM